MSKNVESYILDLLKTPIGAVMMLIVVLVLSGITVLSAVKGNLTAAASGGATLIALILFVSLLALIGK
jgi:small-conductance mechanosensitive channel